MKQLSIYLSVKKAVEKLLLFVFVFFLTTPILAVNIVDESDPNTSTVNSQIIDYFEKGTLLKPLDVCDVRKPINISADCTTYTDLYDTVCDSYQWNSQTYTQSGAFEHTFVGSDGCDSIVTLNLVVYHSTPAVHDLVVCDSLMWVDSVVYTSDTTDVTFMLQTVHGCDSLVTLDLIVNHSSNSLVKDTVCETNLPYVFADVEFNASTDTVFTIQTENGCDSNCHLMLTVLEVPSVSFTSQSFCVGSNYHLTPVVTPQGAYNYLWSSNPPDPTLTETTSPTIDVKPTQSTIYTVKVSHVGTPGCFVTKDTVLVKVMSPTAIMRVTPEFLTYDNHTFEAYSHSENVDHMGVEWHIDGNIYSYDNNITYEMPLTDDTLDLTLVALSQTCSDTLTRQIVIRKSDLYIPNVFTPGEMGNNIFKVHGVGVLDYEIFIYNRRGALVYTSTNIEESWDGTYQGQILPQSSFVYIIYYTTVDMPKGLQVKKGTVTLLR